jgi:hypothetical protein
MFRTTRALIVLAVLGGCQGSGAPQTTAEKCSVLDMQIATTQENDSLEPDAKVEMVDGLEQQKAELNCP